LVLGTFITLLLLPASLYVISDIRTLIKRTKNTIELKPAYQQLAQGKE
jgi:hypothetical protein